jgi:hypothetical protein
MRMKCILVVIAAWGWCGTASAQLFGQPGSGTTYGLSGLGPSGGFMPNIYNPQSQPLSPYLNMFRGANNPAANYYFGTRPGTVGGSGGGMGGAPNIAVGGPRTLFFPGLASGADPLDLPEADPTSATVLPPAGHPVVFNNTMGYFPNPFGNRFGGGNNRMGMGGAGGNRPPQAAPRR